MISFRDMTFCREKDCSCFGTCFRSLTDKVHEDAKDWWGGDDYPIAVFVGKPTCFKEKNYD